MPFAVLATFLFAAWFAGLDPTTSLAQSAPSIQSSSAGTVLVAVLPQTARATLRVLPADPLWFGKGFTGNLLVIEQQWSIARGTTIDAECSLAPPWGEIAELLPLEKFAGMQGAHSFVDSAGVRRVSLAPHLQSGANPLVNQRALLLAHTVPLTGAQAKASTDPIVFHIRLIAF